jgi:hypothetical protein
MPSQQWVAQGRELNGGSGSHRRDLRWTVEERPNDADT